MSTLAQLFRLPTLQVAMWTPAVLMMLLAQAGPPTSGDRELYDVNLAVDIPITVAAGSMALVRILWRDDLARKSCPCDPAGLNAFDRGSVGNHSNAAGIAGDVTVYGTMLALPLLDLWDLGTTRALAEDLMVYAETVAVDTGLQNAVNFAVSRPRPRAYAGDPQFVNSGEGYLSFYAGHVATAFTATSAAAFTLQRRYRTGIWPWIAVALLGGSVAVERVASGHHFPSDVAVAAVVGTATGITVPLLHLRKGVGRVTIIPTPGGVALIGALP